MRWICGAGLALLLWCSFCNLAQAQVVINELLPDPIGADKENEWLEIKNVSDAEIDLENYFLEDKSGHKFELKLMSEKKLASGKLLVIRLAGSLSLNNDKDEISLFRQASSSAELIDRVSYENVRENLTVGRIPDGALVWMTNLIATPGGENQPIIEATVTPAATSKPTPTPRPVSVVTATPKLVMATVMLTSANPLPEATEMRVQTPPPTPQVVTLASESGDIVLGISHEASVSGHEVSKVVTKQKQDGRKIWPFFILSGLIILLAGVIQMKKSGLWFKIEE